MAAPTPTTRQTPTGFKMPDGYQALITFANKPAVQLWERQVKPPGLDGGDGIDTTTMHNVRWRTKANRHLITLAEASAMCAYDPDSYNDLLSLLNSPQSITVRFPDNSTLAFFGYMQKAEFGELKEGEFPEVTVQITPTNQDPTSTSEQAPVFTAAPGT